MASLMVFGTETEYGFFVEDSMRWHLDALPSALIRNAVRVQKLLYVENHYARKLIVELRSQNPSQTIDAHGDRLLQRLTGHENQEELQDYFRMLGMSGFTLVNGARFYVDAGHPEYSTPECRSAREFVAHHRAGDVLTEIGRQAIEQKLGFPVSVFKDNSDRKGHSFAAHENYCVDPVYFSVCTNQKERRAYQLETFFVTRQIVFGAGKIGCEDPVHTGPVPFQLSQRADFMHARWSLDTMENRGIVNVRDRAYADPRRFRRLHVIVGDANMLDTALWLKVGLTALVLRMLEDDFLTQCQSWLCVPLCDGVSAIKTISRDPELRQTVAFTDGRKATALEIQHAFAEALTAYVAQADDVSDEDRELLAAYHHVLDSLEGLPREFGNLLENLEPLLGILDWPTKLHRLARLKKKRDIAWMDPVMQIADINYHNISNDGYRAHLERNVTHRTIRLVTDAEIEHAMTHPPETTRAYLRGKLVERFGDSIVNIRWNRVRFRKNDERSPDSDVFLDDPFRGTVSETDEILAAAHDVPSLLAELSSRGFPQQEFRFWSSNDWDEDETADPWS